MLRELHIENVAVIERADLELGPGLNILTGETGAGKSILVDAMHAILGSRASRELVRTGAEKAVVCATFDLGRAGRGVTKTRSSATMSSSSAARSLRRAKHPAVSAAFRSRRRSCATWARCCWTSTAKTTGGICLTSGSTCEVWTNSGA